ncbi:hypothetical protein H072_5777 [Dactylellina haptotyla CBS 200.50]|uniref:F-box domain-containing protein n=1 Tax=Dactylellina haptotyla (strain CBS 200.50) TaxID=1284197 RepID=S8ABY1_DACHA|nr:hypothetical protein H072_5777 [Dactylellina haptotyla CBS 200.50]
MQLSHLEKLPDELIAHILTFLNIASIISLHRVSSRIRSISRYDRLWRSCCFQTRIHTSGQSLRDKTLQLSLQPSHPEKFTIKDQTAWLRSDQPYVLDTEDGVIDWYKEFQYRHAALTDQSFIKFHTPGGLEIVDVALAGGIGTSINQRVAATALEDGSICIFSLSDSRIGKIQGRSRADLIPRKSYETKPEKSGEYPGGSLNYERGLFVDAATAYETRAWFGAGSVLTEVDLVTMQKIRTHRLPFSVTCLSPALPVLAVGTSLTIHLLDSRSPYFAATTPLTDSGTVSESCKEDVLGRAIPRLDKLASVQPPPLSGIKAYGDPDKDEWSSRDYLQNAPPTAFLQPSPLSIIHSPRDQAGGNEMYVAGRFPSIMAYDRRQWPRLAGTLHSGGRLSGLSIVSANPSLSSPSKYALVACGEYGGRGTLEVYPLPSVQNSKTRKPFHENGSHAVGGLGLPSVQKNYAKSTSIAMKNRQSASRSKIFSVANQGIKLVTGDSEGRIRFVERDGVTHIRDWVGPWGSTQTGVGCIRKIVPLEHPHTEPSVENSDLLIAGEDDVGVLTFNFPHADLKSDNHVQNPSNTNLEEECYVEGMRTALEHHSSEVTFLRHLN